MAYSDRAMTPRGASSSTKDSSAVPFPDIDPIAFQIGPLAIRWYGLAYMAGLLLGYFYIRRLIANSALWRGSPPLTSGQVDDLLVAVTIGVVVGGRLGFVVLYEPGTFLNNPMEVLRIWNGGMAFHGGLIGTALAMWVFAKWQDLNVLSTFDLVAAATPIGLFFGRIANFINGELWGRVTDMPWGVVFPEVERLVPQYPWLAPTVGQPRHPSQLYEAALEGLLLFAALWFVIHHRKALMKPGLVAGLFLIGYGAARTFVELFREYDPDWATSFGPYLTSGMVYSIPMIVLGIFLYVRAKEESGDRATV